MRGEDQFCPIAVFCQESAARQIVAYPWRADRSKGSSRQRGCRIKAMALDLKQIVSQLKEERDQLEAAILNLELMESEQRGRVHRGPKPPSGGGAPPSPSRPPGSGTPAFAGCVGPTRPRRETNRGPC